MSRSDFFAWGLPPADSTGAALSPTGVPGEAQVPIPLFGAFGCASEGDRNGGSSIHLVPPLPFQHGSRPCSEGFPSRTSACRGYDFAVDSSLGSAADELWLGNTPPLMVGQLHGSWSQTSLLRQGSPNFAVSSSRTVPSTADRPAQHGLNPCVGGSGVAGTGVAASKSTSGQTTRLAQVNVQLHKTRFCEFFRRNRCKRGQQCLFAHSEAELRQAPDLTKTKLCLMFGGVCTNPGCSYAHSYAEIRPLRAGDHTNRFAHDDRPPQVAASECMERAPYWTHAASSSDLRYQ